jgi:DNA polymerase II large subunit
MSIDASASPGIKHYFHNLEKEVEKCYELAKTARKKGKDPSTQVEIPLAQDLASRVEAMVGVNGISAKIRKHLSKTGGREATAIKVAREVASEQFKKTGSRAGAVEVAVRSGLAILTGGVLVAPIEGIAGVKIGDNADGSSYVSLYFAGPIRSAGGTAQAMSVLIADVVRRELGIGRYDPTAQEIERYKEEVPLYNQVASLQYNPTDEEIETIVTGCPVCITGEPTEEQEVQGNRNLKRIETNRLRGGAMLVIAEGLGLKAPKLQKIVKKAKIGGWEFLDRLIELKSSKTEEVVKNSSPSYMKEIIAGRPVFSHPSKAGGFNLKYGKTRGSGFAACAINPSTMFLLDEFLATGTQMKTEFPGKGAVVCPCEDADGPLVLLDNNDLVEVQNVVEAKSIRSKIAEIISIGDIILSFGDFLENNHPLLPGKYSYDWWVQDLEEKLGVLRDCSTPQGIEELDRLASRTVNEKIPHSKDGEIDLQRPDPFQAFKISEVFDVPLHPRYNLCWHDISSEDFFVLKNAVREKGTYTDGKLLIPLDPRIKKILIELGAAHLERGGKLILEKYAYPVLRASGMDADPDASRGIKQVRKSREKKDGVLALVSQLSGVKIMPRSPTRVGARMGRPEKAAPREMKPPPHVLFPIKNSGGSQRLLKNAVEKGKVKVRIGMRKCPRCGVETPRYLCPRCEIRTRPLRGKIEPREIDIKKEFELAKEVCQEKNPKKIKAVKKLLSAGMSPEPLEKGILRANEGVWVFKDGTIRYDQTNAPLTHFKPVEIGSSVDALKKLGYTTDWLGNELKSSEQLCELKPQDVILPRGAGDYMLGASHFIDSLLKNFYGLNSYYNAKKPSDLLGHLVIGLSPHTSAGIIGRIIGFSPDGVGWAHPYFHAAKRRNCLSPETKVFVLGEETPKLISIKSLYDGINSQEQIVDDFFTREKRAKRIKTLSFNLEKNKFEGKEVISVIRTQSPTHHIEIETESGRRFMASKEHRIIVQSNGGLKTKKIIEAARENLLIPERIDLKEMDIQEIDLLKEVWNSKSISGLMVGNAKEFLKELSFQCGESARCSKKLKLAPNLLSNYICRGTVPLEILKEMLRLCNGSFSDLPENCSLKGRGEKTEIPRLIKVDNEFMRLVGYYLSSGHLGSRAEKGCCACWVFSEEELIQDCIKCIEKTFGIEPHLRKTRMRKNKVILPGKLAYYLFENILQAGRNRNQKRIPPQFFALPKEKVKELLKAYFSVKGSVAKGKLRITSSSVNEELLRDIGFMLLRFGIFYRLKKYRLKRYRLKKYGLKKERRKAGRKVRDFYSKKGEKVPEYECFTISVGSSYARKFYECIGFVDDRKKRELESNLPSERKPRVKKFRNFILDEIKEIKAMNNNPGQLYDMEVKDNHNFLINDFVLSSNCDGDEDALMLLLDALLNFSNSYLPEKRGGKMDAPLLITTQLDPFEVDEEVYNLDRSPRYPLELYRSAAACMHPKELEGKINQVRGVLGTDAQYEGFYFTHDTRNLNSGPHVSSYTSLETMDEKIHAQLKLAEKVKAVDADDVAAKLLDTHFLKDLQGNLRAFFKQSFRCTSCNTKYRRIPLNGKCLKCGGELTLTVHEQSIKKYLEIAREISDSYNIPFYLDQRLRLIEENLFSMFDKGKVRKTKLTDYL